MKTNITRLALIILAAMPLGMFAQSGSIALQDSVDSVPAAPYIGAVSVLKKEDFNKGVIHTPLQLIQGRVPGLLISRPGSDPNGHFQSRLRGLHTFGEGYAEPLIVVDGFPQTSLLAIDPEDIESITVLRDAASSARYGLRGGSGVILINTHSRQEPGLRVRYRGALATESVAQRPSMMDAGQFRRTYSDPGTPFFRPDLIFPGSTNWIDEVTRTGFSQWHQVQLAQGAKNGNYNLSMHFRDTDGVARSSGYTQFNARLGLEQRLLNDRLSLGADLAYTNREGRHVVTDVFRLATVYNPTMPVRSDTALSTGGYAQILNFGLANPVSLVEQITNESKQTVATAQARGAFQIAPGLQLSSRYGRQEYNSLRGIAAPKTEFLFGLTQNGQAQRFTDDAVNQHTETVLEYTLPLREKQLRMMGGYSWQRIDFDEEGLTGRDFVDATVSYEALLSPDRYKEGTGRRTRNVHEMAAWWGQARLDLDNGLSVVVTARHEGSSRLGQNNKWAFMPAVQGSYKIKTDALDDLRLRVGYGLAGNVPQQSFLSLLTFSEGVPFYYDGAFQPSQTPLHLGNRNLQREMRKELNAGFDIALKNRLFYLSFDFFHSRSEGVIRRVFEPMIVPGTGDLSFTNRYANVADLTNTGIDLVLGGNIISQERFSWSVVANSWWGRTRIGTLTRAPYELEPFSLFGNLGSTGTNFLFRLEENQDFGRIWAPQFRSITPNGQWDLSAEAAPVAQAMPQMGFGIANRVRLGRLDAEIFFDGLIGHSKASSIEVQTSSRITINNYNLNTAAVEAPLDALQSFPFFSDFFVRDASFIRLQNVVLGYTLPVREGKWISGLRFYVTGQNLFSLSRYRFGDPDVLLGSAEQGIMNFGHIPTQYGAPRMNAISPGPEPPAGTYFMARTVMLGVELKF
ncbi:MAG: SusC/RagA family TonB-linked outer membrane protein [Saprospiraceae bacterium]|nr:SusC/RagA family TonB-linked outer membrane protein [Saprospiraceae bacterium]